MEIKDFDKIYVLHLSHRCDRYQLMEQEFKRMDLWKDISIWWTCSRPISNYCGEMIESLHTEDYDNIWKSGCNPNIYGGVFNCSLEHYNMIKTSYERGFNHILIFEDDICFYKDRKYFDKCLSKMRKDIPICKLYYTSESTSEYKDTDDEIFVPIVKYGISSTAAYALNREGMKIMIDIYNKKFTVADLAFLEVRPINKLYINKYRICYINSTKSDIFH